MTSAHVVTVPTSTAHGHTPLPRLYLVASEALNLLLRRSFQQFVSVKDVLRTHPLVRRWYSSLALET